MFVKSFGNQLYEQVDKSKTLITKVHLFAPKVTVFTTNSDGDITVYFVKLKRRYLVWWQTDEITYKSVLTEAYLSDEDKEKQSEENMDALYESIKSGDLTEGDNQDIATMRNYNENIEKGVEVRRSEGEILMELGNTGGEHEAELVLYEDDYTVLKVDGKAVAEYVAAPVFSYNGKYIYYTKYKVTENDGDEDNYTGKIYQYSVNGGSEREIYAFGASHWMGLGANEEYVVYTLESGETGVIDLDSRKKTVIVTFEMLPSSDPSEIVYVDEDEAHIIPNDYDYLVNGDIRTVVIDLKSLEYTEQ
ncbi:hypothetical protein JW710_02390 [Candidatus Dojkabacteria bacterium]|nr:hypothetical protein [Candidatus Dojkabacteria bacterium]